LLLIVIFASELHLIPVRPNWEEPKDWFVPALILAIAPAGILARMTRTAVLENLNADYVRTARAKGLDERGVLWGHILKNASIPLLTHLGPVMFELIAASFVIELMFSFPGFGQEYYRSITRLDYPVILALTLLYGALIAIANLGSDILYAVLDPRIRLG
jgi:ABC-type dipeptide/oligopeptide/nickel transport system permease component